MSNKKVLTLVEGRKINYRTVNDMKEQTAKTGWGFSLLEHIDQDTIDRCDFDKYFSDYVLWRDLDNSVDAVSVMRILSWLNKSDKITVNTNYVGGRSFNSDKYYQHSLYGMDKFLAKYTPVVQKVKNKDDVRRKIKEGKLKYPIVLKECFGTAGKGIVLVNGDEQLDRLNDKWMSIIAEPYIVADYDWRVFVVGGVAVGAMRKEIDQDRPGDFVAKSAGSKEKQKEEDPEILLELSRIACRMAAVCGLEYTGCDIIRDKYTGRFYVLETNNSAGWQNRFNEITGLNMGQILIEYFDDMSILKEEGFYAGVKAYAEKRIKYLYSDNRGRFEKIMNWSEETERVSGNDLGACLQNCYYDILHGGDVKDAKALIDEVERRPLSWAGNFLGSPIHGEDGVFEDACIPTGYYLAIREKYDKMVGVN